MICIDRYPKLSLWSYIRGVVLVQRESFGGRMKATLAKNQRHIKRGCFQQKGQNGFTLLELLVVIAIVGLLAALAMTSYRNFILRSELSETATKLGQFAREFEIWKQVHGKFPNDSHLVLPPEAKGLAINNADWSATTRLGGNWNWEGPDGYAYAGISIDGATATEEEIAQFDFILDDGDLGSGKFRRTPNGRYTYIIEE